MNLSDLWGNKLISQILYTEPHSDFQLNLLHLNINLKYCQKVLCYLITLPLLHNLTSDFDLSMG